MAARPTGYLSYLLRLWREDGSRRSCWRASLESPVTGDRVGFSDLQCLCDFLRTQIAQETAPAATTDNLGDADSQISEDV